MHSKYTTLINLQKSQNLVEKSVVLFLKSSVQKLALPSFSFTLNSSTQLRMRMFVDGALNRFHSYPTQTQKRQLPLKTKCSSGIESLANERARKSRKKEPGFSIPLSPQTLLPFLQLSTTHSIRTSISVPPLSNHSQLVHKTYKTHLRVIPRGTSISNIRVGIADFIGYLMLQ